MTQVFLNRIATATPRHQVHGAFSAFAMAQALGRDRTAFAKMASRAGIASRQSVLHPSEPEGSGTSCGFYRQGGAFPGTRARMQRWEAEAPALAEAALERLGLRQEAPAITHIIVATCTGFVAPGLDRTIIDRFGLPLSVERTTVGFMGCQAAINALKLAWHVVRSEPGSRVLVVCLELCTLHLQDTTALEQLLCFLLFADGCAAAIVSAEATGLLLDGFSSVVIPEAHEQITWRIGDAGFDMTLSGMVPFTLAHALPGLVPRMLKGRGVAEVDLWAVHPGGRSILDAVAHGLDLPGDAMETSRSVLSDHGNMSSATVLFVLERMMREGRRGRGCALAFGPGLSAEAMRFEAA
ncbi:type III polyketide synthase [Roseomonas stagni]|uniref:Type III polyketide synthase n=1 Tax=Falsiroseomonas algicola TaxID=2716930 RepID=A0A6M1LJE7_9PROT|nr:3-oxoacyl-[acyl-carrier-protein] synthase III C-terminal domain-containing protein [Falsiroseomonas algicola]NGM20014.1 type III polyketide synthase [Falsiroseomonas algicola]